MPRGDKSSYTDKQKRQAEHIEKGYKQRGVSKKEAEQRAWATVNQLVRRTISGYFANRVPACGTPGSDQFNLVPPRKSVLFDLRWHAIQSSSGPGRGFHSKLP